MSDAVQVLQEADAALSAASPIHVPVGELAPIVAGTLAALSRGDWWVPGIRERAGAVLRGASVERLGNGFAGARPYKVAPVVVSPALRALHGVGLALANPDQTVAVHLGVGSTADGAFYEALNLAALEHAHVVFVLALRSLEGAPVPEQTAADPAAVAVAMGVAVVEPQDIDVEGIAAAVEVAKEHSGPTLVVVRLD